MSARLEPAPTRRCTTTSGRPRFKALDEEAQDRFRGALKEFVGLYAFVSQVMPFTDVEISEGNITLAAGEGAPVYGPSAVGTRKDKEEKEHLSRIIDV